MDVSIRDFRNRLSEYLRRVGRGERLVVTSHGNAVATVQPAQAAPEGFPAIPGVAWAKQNLSRLDGGANAEAGPAYFDAELEERVRKLQLAYGIQADGIIGPETLFALSALEETGPHLTRNIE